MLRAHRGKSEKWDAVSAVISRSLDEQVRQVLIRFLSTLRLIPTMRDSHAFALMASMYSGSMMDQVLESSVPTETHHAWYQVFPNDLVLSLASTHQDESQFSDGVSKKLKSLPRLHSLISNENRAIRVLSVKIQTESSCMAAMAYFLLAQINLGRANLAYEERLQEIDGQHNLWLLTDLYQNHNGEQSTTGPTHFEKFLLLANSPILNKISHEQIAEIARNSQASSKKMGDVVVQRGELLQSVYLLYEGLLGLESRGKSSRDITAGEFIGLASILSGKPYPQTIRVVSAEARLLSISSEEIIHLVDTDHQIAATLLRILAETI
jgi:hypothetical protein